MLEKFHKAFCLPSFSGCLKQMAGAHGKYACNRKVYCSQHGSSHGLYRSSFCAPRRQITPAARGQPSAVLVVVPQCSEKHHKARAWKSAHVPCLTDTWKGALLAFSVSWRPLCSELCGLLSRNTQTSINRAPNQLLFARFLVPFLSCGFLCFAVVLCLRCGLGLETHPANLPAPTATKTSTHKH